MKFSYTNPEDIKTGDIVTNTQTSKIWIILDKTMRYENIYRFYYMSFDGKIRFDIFQQQIKVLK